MVTLTKPLIIVLYATQEGHTRRVAEHVAATLRARGLAADTFDVKSLPSDFSLSRYGAAIVAASVHAGRHEREMIEMVKAHRAELEAMPTAFLSVSLSEAGVERASSPPELRAKQAGDVQKMIDTFFAETGWHPARVKPVAGALLYREYGFIKRLMMRMIARQAGGDTDTSRDYEYTDWEALDRFVDELVSTLDASINSRAARAGSPAAQARS